MSTDFSGFPKKCVKFYRDLAKNNNKTWFEAHKGDFEEQVMDPARRFVAEMGRKLKKLSPRVQADPRVNRSIFRIYRDTRFSKDKTPYKTHLGVWLWEGDGKRMECSGYYFHLEPPNLMLAAGIYIFPKTLLDEYRDSVVDPRHGPALVRAAGKVTRSGPYTLGGKSYKRTPRGYDPKHRRAEFLLYGGLWAGVETKIPQDLYSPEILDYCFEHYKAMLPLHKWLRAMKARAD